MSVHTGFADSIALDTAYLKRGIQEAVDTLATKAMEELDHADDRDASGQDDAEMVRGEAG